MIRRPLVLALLLFPWLEVASQPDADKTAFHLKSVIAENILQESAINKMAQDKNGFIWLGTISGLVRFDGYAYHHYNRIPGDSTSLSDNFVKALYLDRNKRLWIGTFGGLNLYDPIHDSFKRFLPKQSEGALSDGFINDITEDDDGMIWLATYNGLNKFDPSTGRFEVFYPLDTARNPVKDITSVQFFKDTLWIGTQGQGMYFMSGTRIHAFSPVPYGYRIFDIYKRKDLFLLSTETGLISIAAPNRIALLYESTSFRDIAELNNGRVLLCTHHSGLFEWDADTGQPRTCDLRVDGDIDVDRNIGVYSILEDNAQNVWFCYDGLKKISAVSEMFQTIVPPRANSFRRSDKVILSIIPAGNHEIYLATAGGAIHRFDYYANTFTASITSEAIRSAHIHPLFVDSRNRLWGVNKHNELGLIQKGNFVVKKKFDRTTGSLASLMTESINDRLYVGSPSGFIVADLSEKNSYQVFHESKGDKDSLANNTISALLVQNKDSVWVAGGSILHLFLPAEKRFVRFGKIQSHDHYIKAIDLDAKGNVWIARTNSLAYLNKSTSQLEEVSQIPPEPTNFVSLQVDKYGKIWAGTTDGILCYDPVAQRFKKFAGTYGAQDYYYVFSSTKTDDGHLIFGGLNGFTLFHPDDIFEDVTRPHVLITRIGDGQEHPELTGSVYETRKINLTAKYQTLNIDFAGIYYNDPHGLKYAYYLEGVDRNWHHSGSRRYVSYSNLPRGEWLTFHVKATSPSGIESAVRKLSLFITPYFWETTWFGALVILIMLLTIWFVYRMRIAGLKSRQAELRDQVEAATLEIKQQARRIHEMDASKIKFYTNISHEFRTPLTLIAGPVNSLIKHNSVLSSRDRLKSLSLIARNSERMLRLVNQFLDLTKLDDGVFVIARSKVNLTLLARRIYEVFAPLAERHAINFKYTASGKIERCIDADVYEKILYNLLSNAFKFTPDGRAITLAIRESGNDHVVITVSDTGIGIDEAHVNKIFDRFNQGPLSALKGGTGIGLTYVKKLAELHGGWVHVESKMHCGSTFTVTLQTGPDEHAKVPGAVGEKTRIENPHSGQRKLVAGETTNGKYPVEKKTKILVIDDQEDVREFICSSLRPAYSVIEARNGAEGLAQAIFTVPGLIISDIMMPSPNGLELCHLLKVNEITSHIPIVLLTAQASEPFKAEGYKNGADSYITKPFTCETLVARIENLIEGRKKLRNLYFKNAFLEQRQTGRPDPDAYFLRKCGQFVSENLDNDSLTISGFCKYMGMSQTQLYRKLLAVTGMPISDFIQSYRLRQASLLLKSGQYSVAEIAYQVGFRDPSYFTKCFSKHFGFTPSKILKVSTPPDAGHP